MKKMALLVALSLCLFQSCDNDGNEPVPGYVDPVTKAAFEEKYPSAKEVEWKTRNNYIVVDFKQDQVEKEAWFDNSGEWYMTETDVPFDGLPDAVKTAFRQSEYASWKVEDVDMIERRGLETVYVIEVEQNENEVDLYYSPDGILVKTVADTEGNDDYESIIPSRPSSSVEAYVKEHYPSARILEIDRDDNRTEVDILDGSVYRELLFDNGGVWMQTSTEIRISALPAAVLTAIRTSQYAAYTIDDADFIQTPSGEWYLVELESGGEDVKLRIDMTGQILPD